MATLERIRSKGVLLIVIIGLALLAFIVSDFLNNSTSVFNQSKEMVAEIDGKGIKIDEFQQAIEQLTSVYEIEYQTNSIDENTTQQIRQTVWDSFVKENLLASESEKVGLAVSEKELNDLITGNQPHQLVLGRKIFMDPTTGRFDRNRLIGFLNQLKTKPASPQAQEEYMKAKNYWMYFEKLIKNSKLEEKYNVLLSRALNANSLEAKLSFESKKNTVDAAYVTKPYYTIPDSTIAVSESEIAERYDSQKELYKQSTETRSIKYVAFSLTPSQEDFAKAEKWMNELKPEFSTTTEIASVVNANSKPYQDVALSKNQIDEHLRTFAFCGNKNDVVGPVLFGNVYKMARIVETGINEPDSLNIKHIVVATPDVEKTKTLADSILTALNSGADFGQLAVKYSQMKQTASRGGEVGWITVSTMDPEMAKACIAQPTNKNFTYKEGDAIQIIQITEKTASVSKVKLAVIEAEVNPSQETYSKIYNEAKSFAASSSNPELFEKNAVQNGYAVIPMNDIDKNTPRIANYSQSRQVIRWAFNDNTEANMVSDVFDCEKQYIVATVKDITPAGYVPVAKVSDRIKAEIIKDKKADKIIAELSGKKSLEELASQLASSIDTAKQVNFDSRTFGNTGVEPSVIVNATEGKLNTVSTPIKGKNGVFVVKPINIVANTAPFVKEAEQTTIATKHMYAVYTAVEALKESANIEDNRSNFY